MISISIVLYGTPIDQIKRCISSIDHFSGVAHVYFIDNSPTDSLQTYCKSKFTYDYIHMPENPGYGSGHNVAIRKSQKRDNFLFHLVINADVYFDSDVITPMIEYMADHPEVGHMMPKILNTDGSIQYLCKLVPSPKDLIIRRFGSKRTKNYNNYILEMKISGYNETIFVPYLSGCFMLLRHEALKVVGLFDERFFMYPEDIDLTRRIAENYETMFFPNVSVFHQHGAASHKSLKMLAIHAINMMKYFNKWGWFYDAKRAQLNLKATSQFAAGKAQRFDPRA